MSFRSAGRILLFGYRGVYMKIFTAHVRKCEGIKEIQTVYTHSEEAAVLAEKYAEKFKTINIAKLTLKIHDFGKSCKDFDDYINERNDFRRGMIDHCYAGARYVTEIANETKDPKIIETARFIARIVLSHHGLHDWVDENGKEYFEDRIKKDERYDEIKKNIKDIISDEEVLQLLKKAKEEYAHVRKKIRNMCSGREQKKVFAFYMGLFERMILSVLVDADRTNTAEFLKKTNMEFEFGEEFWQQAYEKMEAKAKEFVKQTDPISKQRSSISERCIRFANHEVGICRMIVPTGGGKTLSSLRFALKYCKTHKKERIFYIAPYQSILEQNSDVWKEIVGNKYLLEHHSDILAELNEEEISEYELRAEKWDMPVIATTLVQFLNTFFLYRMDSVRRMHRLSNSVIIIDEVQSMPVKCITLFNLAMNFMKEIGQSCIVLCSATQPTFEKLKYPLKIDEIASMTGDYSNDFLKFERNRIVPQLIKCGYSYKQAADFCIHKFKEEGSVLFVVNTKVAAYSIYQEIKKKKLEGVKILHLSTRMCPEHRQRCIDEIKLNKSQKIICVTTPLIEAGVHISFPCVIRSLAGLASIVQTAGRCNRNGEYHRCCNVYLLNINEEHFGNMREIQNGQNVTRHMLESEKYSDIQAVETLSDYFEKYYQEMKGELNYNVKDNDVETDLLELLSLNEVRGPVWMNDKVKIYNNRQAFKTSGHLFKMIDDHAMSIVVPYDEDAKNIIECLRSVEHSNEWEKKLREAQKYIVGINQQQEKKMREVSAIEFLQSGIYVLDERYYNSECGIQI